MVIQLRTVDAADGSHEIHRLEVNDGKVTRVRSYCFAADVLNNVA